MIYFRDEEVCAVEKNQVPIRSIVEGDRLVARGVLETLKILDTKNILVPNWRNKARGVVGGGYGF
ncbi:MAG: hypothetical protein J3T61_00405 [Candidatus Brocadiales bacterium]|nr:hypothetical protein [Candidatus Bathyanammoxibius sp.]